MKKDITKLIFIEGDLTIKINNILFFKESIAMLEFYFYLDKWLKYIYDFEVVDFEYYSIEIEED
ncbi:hypothetical protein ERX35_010070 [Macrococcus equipercicus]|uniref:DUF7878 domain-containing protein n=1 Tax=Macrococcus equipercicus TaxID=69967 RepID=A0ABQ6R6R8_9STAP|nr:hypothetical protein [Macrococcus equipercicus]KAA1036990.1 hypothetical protein ERX35_010070 [Macrococcus equipercicus]